MTTHEGIFVTILLILQVHLDDSLVQQIQSLMSDLLRDNEEVPIPTLSYTSETRKGVHIMYTDLEVEAYRESVGSYVRDCLVHEKRFEGLSGQDLPLKLHNQTTSYLFNLERSYFPDVEDKGNFNIVLVIL